MVDMTALSALHGSAASADRLRTRRRAQIRLQAYGIAAIVFSGLALVVLMWSVFAKASLVVTETYIRLPVTVEEGAFDPANPRAANYTAISRGALRAMFPEVSGRANLRELGDLFSGGASFELQDAMIADPSRATRTTDFRFLASDDADLYFKGSYGELEPGTPQGRLSMIVTGTDVELFPNANDFKGVLAQAKTTLLAEAARLRREAAQQENGRRVTVEQAASLPDGPEKQALLTRIDGYTAARDQYERDADATEARAVGAGGTEALTSDLPSLLVKVHDGWIRVTEVGATSARGVILVMPKSTDEVGPEAWRYYVNEVPEAARRVSDAQIAWLETLDARGHVEHDFNTRFFAAPDSRDPELAGIWGSIVGSFFTMLITFVLAFPVGVLAAVYLEEFAPKNRWTDLVEVNINNLAAVPSIVFGLLGLSVFIGFFGVPRSAALAGGIVIALMSLPTIIIAARAAIRAVPPSIRDAALGVGASKLQTVFHHVIPLAMPGIMTGTILAMASALGETAPLIMIGMVAFIVDTPAGITDPATVLPVLIYRWADFPERAFEAKTAAAIIVLLVLLLIMNALAIFLRKRFERRW